MKQNEEKKIKGKKLIITLLELAIIVGCIFIIYILMTPKDRVKDSTYSYSKLEEVKEYEIQGEYITRVRPLTEYTTFKETAEYTLNNNRDREIVTNTIKVYTDSSKTQEVTEGYITSGMILEGIPNEDKETEEQTVTYTICVIGDFTKDGDINITELTKIIKGVVGLKDWEFTEEEKLIADFNGDKEVNVVDIEECINYIVYGKLTIENGTKLKATDESGITWNYTYQDGEATDVYYESGVLTETVKIPDNLDGHPVVKLYNSEKYDNIFLKGDEARIFGRTSTETSSLPIKNVIIPNTVTNIGSAAFRWCTTIKNIEISNSVTSIGEAAFEGCTGITNIEIPDSVTSIEARAFDSCINLASIEIPDSVTSIEDGAFVCCTSLKSVEIPDSVTSIEDNAFASCTSLKSIEIPDSVTSIGYNAFYNTAWYRNQPDGVVYAGKVAYKYKGEIPDNTTIELKEGTKEIATRAFGNCSTLTSIEIPKSVTSIGSYAFENCTSLTSIDIPDIVTSIGTNVFYNTAWYNNQPDGVIYAGKVAYEYKGEMPEDTTIELKEGTKRIADRAFYTCRSLTSIEIPDSVTSIGVKAFSECKGLTNITIPDSVVRIDEAAFLWCENLTSVTMSKNVEYMGEGVFAGCTSLNNIVIWKSVNELGYRTFDGWKDNQTINIETNEIPDGWDDNWNYGCNAKIVYGYTAE